MKCGKLNHFAAACRTSQAEQTGPRRPFSGGRGGSKPAYGSVRQISASNPETSGRWNTAGDFVVDVDGYAEYMRFKQANDYGCYRVTDPLLNDGIRATVTIQGVNASCLVDTGSPINVVNEETFMAMHPRPVLESCRTRYFGFGARAPLPILGQFISQIQFASRSTTAGFIVLRDAIEQLIGHHTARALNMVTVSEECTVAQVAQISTDDGDKARAELYHRYPNTFSGKLGCLKGVEIKLDVDPDIRPVRQAQRPVAIHLRDSVE